ncbi:MAG: hypothetical protein ACI8QZ_004300 [Chlamydiales bacterium]|jgi:hypothetical protein
MFKAFVVTNDVHVLPGPLELVAGQGQAVSFEGAAGATYRLSLEPSEHDTVPVLVVAAEADGRVVTDSEPRVDGLSAAPWELREDWAVVDWQRYRPPHSNVLADVITYARSTPAHATEDWTGLTWMTSIGLDVAAQIGDGMALSGDMLLDLELDYRELTSKLVQREPRVVRWSGTARDGGRAVSGLVIVGRADDTLRAISCVGPGPWASSGAPIEAQLARAVELAR